MAHDKIQLQAAIIVLRTYLESSALPGWQTPVLPEAPTQEQVAILGAYRPTNAEQKAWGLGWKALHIPATVDEIKTLNSFEVFNLGLRACDVAIGDAAWFDRGRYNSSRCDFFLGMIDGFMYHGRLSQGQQDAVVKTLTRAGVLFDKHGHELPIIQKLRERMALELTPVATPTAPEPVISEAGTVQLDESFADAELDATVPVSDNLRVELDTLLQRAGMTSTDVSGLSASINIAGNNDTWTRDEFRSVLDLVRARLIQIDPTIQNMLHGKTVDGRQVSRALTPEQIELCYHPGGLGTVDAIAGSGKSTSVLARAYALVMTGVAPSRICILSFTNAAVADLKRGWQEKYCSKFGSYPAPAISTMHSLALRAARELGLSGAVDTTGQVVKPAYRDAILAEGKNLIAVINRRRAALRQETDPVKRNRLEATLAEYELRLALYGNYNEEQERFYGTNWDAMKDTYNAIAYYAVLMPGHNAEQLDDMVFRAEGQKYGIVAAPLAAVGTARIAGDAAQTRGQITFNYMLTAATEGMAANRLRMFNSFDAVILDEAQDVSPLQLSFVFHLVGIGKRRGNLMMVGDSVGQSIMGFQAGRPELIQGVARIPGAAHYRLTTNFRCTDTIVRAGGRLICRPEEHASDTAIANKDNDPAIRPKEFPGLRAEADFVTKEIIDLLADWQALGLNDKSLAAIQPEDIAILYRTKARSAIPQLVLGMHEIPHFVEKGASFWDSDAASVALDYMRLVTTDVPQITAELFVRLMNRPYRGFPVKDGTRNGVFVPKVDTAAVRQRLHAASNDLLTALNNTNWPRPISTSIDAFREDIEAILENLHNVSALLGKIANFRNPLKYHKDYGKLLSATGDENWIEAWSMMYDVEGRRSELGDIFRDRQAQIDQEPSALAFLERIRELKKEAETAQAEFERAKLAGEKLPKVTLTTVHSSKGREWKHVYVIGFEREQFPHKRSLNQDGGSLWGEGEAEERRLGYVAVTRAKTNLTLTTGRPVPRKLALEGVTSMASIYTPVVTEGTTIRPPAVSEYAQAYAEWVMKGCPLGEAPFVVRPKEVE